MTTNAEALRIVDELIDAIESLATANRLTGLWDHVRFEECKKPDELIDVNRVVLAERRARVNVELRAKHRRAIDKLLTELCQIDLTDKA